jgi:hypothetical protein
MPKFLEDKLRAEYGNNPKAIYGTMNKIGAMHGNKETAKGREMERKHEADMKHMKPPFASTHIDHHSDGSHTIRHEGHAKMSGKSPAFMEREDGDSYSAGTGAEMLSKLESKLKIKRQGEEEPEPTTSAKGEPMEREDAEEEA